jgi:hypothetical protein
MCTRVPHPVLIEGAGDCFFFPLYVWAKETKKQRCGERKDEETKRTREKKAKAEG